MQLIFSVLIHKALILLFAIIRTDWNPRECREGKLSGKKKKEKRKGRKRGGITGRKKSSNKRLPLIPVPFTAQHIYVLIRIHHQSCAHRSQRIPITVYTQSPLHWKSTRRGDPFKTPPPPKKKVIRYRSTFTENDLQPHFVILWLDETQNTPAGVNSLSLCPSYVGRLSGPIHLLVRDWEGRYQNEHF